MLPAPDEDSPDVPPVSRWGLGDAAITLLLTLLLGSIAYAVAQALTQGPWDSRTGRAWASILLLVVPWIALAGWPLWASVSRGQGPRRDFGLRLDWRSAGIGFLGGVGSLVGAVIVATVQEALTGHQLSSAVGTAAQDTTSGSRGALVVLALCTAFGAPVVEELAFRGLLFGALLKRGMPVLTSVVVTAVVFAGFHFEPSRIAVLLVLGGGITAVRAYTGSTAASMVAHMTVNLSGAISFLTLAVVVRG